jgi:hypothetical protein
MFAATAQPHSSDNDQNNKTAGNQPAGSGPGPLAIGGLFRHTPDPMGVEPIEV